MQTETAEVMPVDKFNTALAKENITEKVIADLRAAYLPLKIKGIDDKAGYKAVKEARLKTKSLRVLTVKICKKGREDAVAEQRAWVAKEKEISAQIAEVENHLENQETWFEAELQRIKDEEAARQAAIKAEQERKEHKRIQARASLLMDYGITGDYDMLKNSSDDDFMQILQQAKERYEAEQARLAEEEVARNAEEERLTKIAAEQEAERERLAAIAREQEERAAAIRAEQQRIETEKKAAEQEALRLTELEQAKKEAAANALKEAEEQQKRDAAAKAESDRLAKLEAERLEALKPDKEKLLGLVDAIAGIEFPDLATEEAQDILATVITDFGKIQDYLTSQCACLK